MAVTGEVDPSKMLTNAGLKPDQDLILTKPLGVGVITTAIKAGIAGKEIINAAVASMTQLNNVASQVAVSVGATGATDVTGFGLLGHLGKMVLTSSVDAVLDVSNIAFLPGAKLYAEDGVIPGGTRRNLACVEHQIDAGSYGETDLLLLADAQTSGGLIFGVEKTKSDEVCAELNGRGVPAMVVGETHEGKGTIRLR